MERIQIVNFDIGLTFDQKKAIRKCRGYNDGVKMCQDKPNCQINISDNAKRCPFHEECTINLSYSPRGVLTIIGHCINKEHCLRYSHKDL